MSYNRIPLALLMLRLSIFLVMLMWTLDKFLYPEHMRQVFEQFSYVGDVGLTTSYLFTGLALALITSFLFGFWKTFTYGLVFVLYAVSVLLSYRQFFSPFENANLVSFQAWPLLVACFALYYLRELDTMWVYKRVRRMF